MDAECGHIISALLRNHFSKMRVLAHWAESEHDHLMRDQAQTLLAADPTVKATVARAVAHVAWVWRAYRRPVAAVTAAAMTAAALAATGIYSTRCCRVMV